MSSFNLCYFSKLWCAIGNDESRCNEEKGWDIRDPSERYNYATKEGGEKGTKKTPWRFPGAMQAAR
jgi:hypothetical protein